MELAVIAPVILIGKNSDDVFRTLPFQKIQTLLSIMRVYQCLCGKRANPAARVRTVHADSEEAARDRDAEGAASVAGDDRPGQA